MGVSDSTDATKKQESPAKVEDYFKNGTVEFENFDQKTTVKYGDSRTSFMMPRAQTQLPFPDMPQELSEPIAPTKNILFPIKYQSPLTKIASTLEFRLPETFESSAEKS